MKNFYKVFLASAVVLVGNATATVDSDQAAGAAQHPEVKGAIAIVDAWIEGVREYEDVPGISVGFVVDQSTLFSNGYGFANVRAKRPADTDSIYSICSISKLFTSIGVMQLRDEGALRLRDPVADHLPWFKVQPGDVGGGPVRIKGLLTHSSGLPRESDFPYWDQDDFPFPTRAQVIERVSEQQMLYRPDTLFQYSNLGLTLAGEIVAARADMPYEEYVQQKILDPIGLSDTRTYFPKELHGKQMAIGYRGQLRDDKRKPLPPFYTRGITPAAGFTSSVNDLAKFASWQFRALDGKDDGVLSAETLREMQQVAWVDPDWKTTWGLGFVVSEADGNTVVGHGGGCPGYITSFLLVPKHKIAAIALTNASDGPAQKISMNMLKTIAAALQKVTTPPEAAPIDFAPFEGNYGSKIWGGEMALRGWGKHLVGVRIPSDEIKDLLKLKHVQGDQFVRVTDDGEARETWVFQRDDDGVVIGVKSHSNVYRRL